MVAAHRREPERPRRTGVLVGGVLLATDTEEAEVEQPSGSTEGTFAVELRSLEVGEHPGSRCGKRRREVEHPLVLLPVEGRPPGAGGAELSSPRAVISGRRERPVVRRTDPHVRPCRRDREVSEPGERCGGGGWAPFWSGID